MQRVSADVEVDVVQENNPPNIELDSFVPLVRLMDLVL